MISAKAQIVPATADDISRFYGAVEFKGSWFAKAIRKGSLVAAVGGAFEVSDGEWLGFLNVPLHERRWSIYRHTVELIGNVRDAGGKTFKATCDMRIPRALEFMQRLGFVETDETIEDRTVWVKCLD